MWSDFFYSEPEQRSCPVRACMRRQRHPFAMAPRHRFMAGARIRDSGIAMKCAENALQRWHHAAAQQGVFQGVARGTGRTAGGRRSYSVS